MTKKFGARELVDRARQLVRLNPNQARENGYRATFRHFLAFAQTELATGDTRFWIKPTRLQSLQSQLAELYRCPFGMRVGAEIAAIQDEIQELERAA